MTMLLLSDTLLYNEYCLTCASDNNITLYRHSLDSIYVHVMEESKVELIIGRTCMDLGTQK